MRAAGDRLYGGVRAARDAPRPAMRNDVRELRSHRGISQADLGAAVGVSRQTINSIEKNRYLPSLPLALALARYFDTPVEEIFHAEPDLQTDHS